MNIFDSLEQTSRRHPDREALIFKGQSTSYRELRDQADRLSAALKANFDLQPGARVALFLPNIPAFIAAYYATQRIGAMAVSLNVMLKRAEVEFILRDCGAQLLITVPQLADQVPAAIPTLQAVIGVGDTNLPGWHGFSDLLAGSSPLQTAAASVEADTGAAILYTSGTTGHPKGVLLSHGNLIFNTQVTIHHTRMTADDRLLCYLPLFHCFGQNFIMNAAVHAGAALILHERFLPDEILEAARRHQATVFLGVPAVYLRLLSVPDIEKQLATVRYYFSAAATMPVEVARRWRERFGQCIYEGYGLTETSPFATYNHDTNYREGSVGTPVRGVEVKIVDEHGARLPPGELGEIAIRGPNVMNGYFNRPEETAEVIRDGWFWTGDIGRLDEEGFLYLVDRAKDMVNVSGFKVWPREVEEILSTLPGLAEAAVIGVPDPATGEAVKVFAVKNTAAQLTEQNIIDFCRARIAVYKAPRHVEFIDALPRNPSGKVLKRELRLRQEKKIA